MEQKKKMNVDKSTLKLMLVLVLTVFITGTVTYGFFVTSKKQTGKNEVVSGCFNVELSNESASIALSNAYPISNEKGQELTPYTFTITNTCSIDVAYSIVIDTKSDSFSSTHINASVDKGVPITLTNEYLNTTYPAEAGYSSSHVLASGSLKTEESKTFDIRVWINEGTIYEDVQGKNWEGQVRVVNVVKAVNDAVNPSAVTTLLKKANDASVTDYSTGNQQEMFAFDHPEATQTTGWSAEERRDYRYIGWNPNNYITFNDEMWRIIGVFTVETEGGNKEQLMKIIRDESIGSLAWDAKSDTTYSNEWSTSALNALLNGEYYNTEGSFTTTYYNYAGTAYTLTIPKGLNSIARNQIANIKWSLGGSNTSQNLGGPDYYAFERGTAVYSENSTNIIQKVGLMYPSDFSYTYANGIDDTCFTDGINCNAWKIPKKGWLYNSQYQWTLSTLIDDERNAFYVDHFGSIIHSLDYNTAGVRPTVYLSSSVKIVGGDGSSGSPYRLSL